MIGSCKANKTMAPLKASEVIFLKKAEKIRSIYRKILANAEACKTNTGKDPLNKDQRKIAEAACQMPADLKRNLLIQNELKAKKRSLNLEKERRIETIEAERARLGDRYGRARMTEDHKWCQALIARLRGLNKGIWNNSEEREKMILHLANMIENLKMQDPRNADNEITDVGLESAKTSNPTFCTCKNVSYGSMVECCNKDCEIKWFHFACVGIVRKPARSAEWYCKGCTEQGKVEKIETPWVDNSKIDNQDVVKILAKYPK